MTIKVSEIAPATETEVPVKLNGHVYLIRGVAVLAPSEHGTVGWKHGSDGSWQKLVFCLGHGWLLFDDWSDMVYHDPRIRHDA